MNERVKQLLAQPAFERLQDWAEVGPIQRATLESFTEMIVKECIQVCDEVGERELPPYGAVAWDCADELRKHFGVK